LKKKPRDEQAHRSRAARTSSLFCSSSSFRGNCGIIQQGALPGAEILATDRVALFFGRRLHPGSHPRPSRRKAPSNAGVGRPAGQPQPLDLREIAPGTTRSPARHSVHNDDGIGRNVMVVQRHVPRVPLDSPTAIPCDIPRWRVFSGPGPDNQRHEVVHKHSRILAANLWSSLVPPPIASPLSVYQTRAPRAGAHP